MAFNKYTVSDPYPGQELPHRIEVRQGFDVCAGLLIEPRNIQAEEWLLQSVMTKDAHQGQGLARRMVDHVEAHYGPVVVQSENDAFWSKMGFKECEDGFWRRDG